MHKLNDISHRKQIKNAKSSNLPTTSLFIKIYYTLQFTLKI